MLAQATNNEHKKPLADNFIAFCICIIDPKLNWR
jgi:hypothetical protein